jgi:hypothetical protein
VIVAVPVDPDHHYRVRFPDGTEASFPRRQLSVRRRIALGKLPEPDDREQFAAVQLRCVVGSRAYGLEGEGSDTDRRGFFLPSAGRHWSPAGVPEQIEDEAAQETYWEVRKFLLPALKANPNVLECLFTPLVETATPLAAELPAMRGAFVSRLIFPTYNDDLSSKRC